MPDVDEDFTEVLRFDIDGIEVMVAVMDSTGHGAEESEFEYKIYGDPLVGEFYSNKKLSTAALTKLATAAYNEARISRIKSRIGLVPELDGSLNAEIERIGRTQTTLHAPSDWKGEYDLTPAKDFVGDRLDAEDCWARADYAEVSEDGIAYGYNLNASLLGDILVGEMLKEESESDYAERVNEASNADTWSTVERFFQEEFGADLRSDGDYGDVTAEFFVKYGPGGIRRASTQQMGDRVESESKLLGLRDSWEYGGRVQGDLATKLGYRYERLDTNDFFTAGHYVKEDA